MTLGLNIDTGGGVYPVAPAVAGWELAIEQADTLDAIASLSALMGHKFNGARQRGRMEPTFWRAAFAALHARRDALLAELQAAEAAQAAPVAAPAVAARGGGEIEDTISFNAE